MLAQIRGLMYKFVLFDRRIFSTPPLTISNLSLSPKCRGISGSRFTLKAIPVSVLQGNVYGIAASRRTHYRGYLCRGLPRAPRLATPMKTAPARYDGPGDNPRWF